MSVPTKSDRALLTRARLTTSATLFVCAKCSRGKERRREFKAAMKAAGAKRQLRVVACACLDLCPKRGTATVITDGRGPARCAIVADSADGTHALALLLGDERARDAVSD
jgi:hypothetical protein